MKPEHYKEFNAEHAKAGAPYCQRKGLAARIGIWDTQSYSYHLTGVRVAQENSTMEIEASWSKSGVFLINNEMPEDLVMLPLGYCEGKPVFVGDELMDLGDEDWRKVKTMPHAKDFTYCKWPRTKPVMPVCDIHAHSAESIRQQEYITNYLISNQREEIEAYWKALDEFNEVKE